jgi:hypothetical protein
MTTRSINRDDTFASIGHLIVANSGGDVALSDTDIDFETLAPRHLPPRGFMIAVAGDVHIRTFDGKDDTYLSGELVVGLLYPFSVKRVWSTGTNASMKCRIYW